MTNELEQKVSEAVRGIHALQNSNDALAERNLALERDNARLVEENEGLRHANVTAEHKADHNMRLWIELTTRLHVIEMTIQDAISEARKAAYRPKEAVKNAEVVDETLKKLAATFGANGERQ